jgi:hypothetical protein
LLAWFELAARLERRPEAATVAWYPRAAAEREARPSAGVLRRWAQPAASAVPGAVLRWAAVGARYAQREAAAEASRASAAAVVRQPEAAAVLRAQAVAVAAGQAGAVALPREAAAGAVLPGAAEGVAAEGAQRAGAAEVQRQAVAAPRDGGQRREARASAWVFHPDQVRPWPARPPWERFARAMKVQRIALP